MTSIVSKKYTKALLDSIGAKKITSVKIKNALNALKMLNDCFANDKFDYIIKSPTIKKDEKESLLLSIINTKDKKIINFIKILNQKNRLNEIPFIYEELKKSIDSNNNEYELTIQSSFEIDSKDEEHIKKELSKKLGVSLKVVKKHMDIEGIRLFVDGISVESSFLKYGFSSNLKKHILKAF